MPTIHKLRVNHQGNKTVFRLNPRGQVERLWYDGRGFRAEDPEAIRELKEMVKELEFDNDSIEALRELSEMK